MLLTRRIFALILIAAGSRADTLDDIVHAEMDRQHIPGVALGVIREGESARLQGFGTADLEHRIPVTPQTVFKIGSVSKQFIAAGILLLVDEGKLSLDDSVRKFLEDAPADWEGVTVRRLLSHTGGLIREGPGFHPFRVQPDIDVIRSAYSARLEFRPGEKWQYSNIGYFAASEIIRRVSGKPWDEFISERIFQPLGMKASRATTAFAIVPNRAGGYDWQNGEFRNAVDFLSVRPSGAFLSSLEDLVRWDDALSADVPLKKKLRKLMWEPVPLNDTRSSGYGLGWQIGDRMGKRVLSHGGTLGGFRSYYVRFPDERLSIIVLTNLSSAKPDDIVWKIAAALMPGLEQPTPTAQ
jgi:D-alanyl-D-alanine carboxypeptidase